MLKLLISIFFTFIIIVQPAIAEAPLTEDSCENVLLSTTTKHESSSSSTNPIHSHDCHHCPNSSHTCHIGHCAFPISAQIELSFFNKENNGHLLSNSLLKLSDFSSCLFRPPIA